MKRGWAARIVAVALVALAAASCTAGEEAPSQATYTIKFPSTAAAIAADYVQLYVFDVAPAERASLCQNLVAARKRKDPLKPVVTGLQVNICEMSRGAKPITIPYGEKAVLAVVTRDNEPGDFMTGCVIQTFGDGLPLLSIPVGLSGTDVSVPATACASVSDRCNKICVAN